LPIRQSQAFAQQLRNLFRIKTGFKFAGKPRVCRPTPMRYRRQQCRPGLTEANGFMASGLPSALLNLVLSNGPIDDLLGVLVPVQFFAAPVRLGRHNTHQRMREAMIDSGVRLRARLHRLKPVHQMTHIVIVRAK
jgi:hypothetical protein